MDVFDLLAKLILDTSEYEDGLNNARDSAEKGGSGIGKALGTAGKVAGAAIAAASTAIVGFGASSVAAGADFDKSMSQVAATMGYTVDDLNDSTSEASQNFNRLRDFAQEMGSTTAFSATQAADALNYMALAGYDTETSIQMLPSVLDLAASGSMDLARASDMVTDTQSALGLSLEETSTLVDQMARTASKSNTSVEQLGDAMLTIGATARNVAGGTTELSTVLGVLADNGIKGAEGGTHLRNILLSLQSPTEDAADMLAQLGVEVYDSEGNMRSMIDVVEDLKESVSGHDQASRDYIISQIFNKTDLAAVNALLGTSKERFDELTVSIGESQGAAEAMAATQLDNLAGDITLFKSALEGAQIAVSDGLTPTLREFVQFGADSLSTLTAAFKEDGLQGALEALDGVIEQGIEKLFNALPKVIDAGARLLQAVINGIIKNLPQLIKAAKDIVMSLSQRIVESLPDLIDATIEIVLALADGIIEALPELIPAIVEVITTIVTKLTEPDTLTKLIEAAFEILGALSLGLIKAIPQLLTSVPEIIGNLVTTILDYLPEITTVGIELVGELAAGIINGASQAASAVLDLLIGVKDVFWEGILAAKDWGKDLIANFINGLAEKASDLWENMKTLGKGIKSYIGFSEPEQGPLSDFHTYAPDMMELFAQGIKDNKGMLMDTVADAFDFGDMTVKASPTINSNTASAANDTPITIIVQSVLDGKIIGETATQWQRRQARAYG